MKRAKLIALIASIAATFTIATACESPDSQKRFDEYSEIVGNEPPSAELCDSEKRDISGKYFVRLQHSISRENHILLELDITPQGNNYKLIFQPLKTDMIKDEIDLVDENGDIVYRVDADGNLVLDKNGDPIPVRVRAPRDDARTPTGSAIVLENVPVTSKGELQANLDRIVVNGDANSFTWGEIEADISVTVASCAGGLLCAKGTLETYRPVPFKNKTVTFGATLVDTIDQDSKAPVDCDSDAE